MKQLTRDNAEKRLSDMNMGDMPVIEYRPHPARIDSDWFKKYKKLRREFIMSLTDSVELLAMMNLTQDEFMALIMGRALPDNFSLRMRIPLIWGGNLSIDNMFMCRTFPHSQKLDKFILDQYGNDIIWLPNPAKKIYIPLHNISGGDGGNAASDRLSQIAAQIVANRGME